MMLKLSAIVASFVVAFDTARAWTFNVSDVVSPDKMVGNHQPLQRTWTVSSFAQLQELYLAVPGPVFVDLHPSLLPTLEGGGKDDPSPLSPQVPGVVPGKTPGVIPGETPGVIPGKTPGVIPGKTPGVVQVETPRVVPGETLGVVPGETPGVVPGKTPGVVPGETPGAVQGETSGVVPGKTPGVVPGETPGIVPGKTPGVVPGETPGIVQGETSGVVPGETPGIVPGKTPGVIPGETPGAIPGVEPGKAPDAVRTGEFGSERSGPSLANGTVELSKHHRRHNDIDDSPSRNEETVVAMIIVSGNASDLLNMFEAAPLHPHRNDGLKLHLKNEDALAQGYVLTQIYLFDKNLLRRVTTAFHGDVVLSENVMTLNDTEADVKFASVGDGNLYVDCKSNVSLSSLQVEVTGSGLVQLSISSISLVTYLNVDVVGTAAFALITNALSADEVNTSLSGSGILVVSTSNFVAQKLASSVYGSGVASFATAGTVDKEFLALSGSGQLLAGSIVATRSTVHVGGDGEMLVQVSDKLTVSASVWGKVAYVNAPPAHIKIKGWWFWRDASTIVQPAAVNKVVIYDPVALPTKKPVYCLIETVESALSDEPDCSLVSAKNTYTTNGMTTSLSKVSPIDGTSGPSGLLYAFLGAGVVVMNVVAARSWAQRRARRHYVPLL
ncbi:hypothetical protein PsorP6_010209 [Peronosclerospora sorghi]|uniref:Uncharacterized protein n=1 Tax=Peronosclerospora sorghi TaxID=230839 RepID=A0ACC0VVQ2_9STRA|nr:hypothetical protein PsorP6_010209 [Peronosclerospora sorghi]